MAYCNGYIEAVTNKFVIFSKSARFTHYSVHQKDFQRVVVINNVLH